MTQIYSQDDMPPLVTAEWLLESERDNVAILDCTYTLPSVSPDAKTLFDQVHIPGAQFFDIDAVSDPKNPLPHMLPPPEAFARHAGALGIDRDTPVVVYDRGAMMSAPRVWWTFRVFGHRRIAVLDGGLDHWTRSGLPVTQEATCRPAPRSYVPVPDHHLVVGLDQVAAAAENGIQVVDARSVGRFSGQEAELRANLRSGHIPGSRNVPFAQLRDAQSGLMKSPQAIAQVFSAAGLRADAPVICSCGSGVTACALAFGLHLAGRDDIAVYDGSWAEWGSRHDLPVEVSAFG